MPEGKIVAVGHVVLPTKDVPRLVTFYRKVMGLKHVIKGDYFNAFEVGDVHFCIFPGEHGTATFDLTSDDVDVLRDRLVKNSVTCTECQDDERSGHRFFVMTDPDGHQIRINSSHESMREVE